MPSSQVMSKWKAGKLHSGSKGGPLVTSQEQAVAIKLSEQRKEKAQGGRYHKRSGMKGKDAAKALRGR